MCSEENIEAINEKIKKVEEAIEICADLNERMQLRREKEQLRREKEQLRDENLILLRRNAGMREEASSSGAPQETEKYLISKSLQIKASDFASSKGQVFMGFGLTSHYPFYDPTDVEEDTRKTKIYSHFKLSDQEISESLALEGRNTETFKNELVRLVLVYNDISSVSETVRGDTRSNLERSRDIQHHHLDGLAHILPTLVSTTSKPGCTLASFGCPAGLATGTSIPAGILMDVQMIPRGIIEAKSGCYTPSEAIRQAVAEGSNVALEQLRRGVALDDVVVPIVGTNGYLMQFGAVFLLKPSFPVFVMVSHVLDLTNDFMLHEAARLLCCIRIMTSKQLIVGTPFMAQEQMMLDVGCYHCKKLSAFFSSTGNIQTSLFHLFRVFSVLHADLDCRLIVGFPISVREYEDNNVETCLIFPKLSDYFIGLPSSPLQRKSFVKKLEAAISNFHRVGVVHLDLYLSNIMWRIDSENEVVIKVIDWDSAHFLSERLPDDVEKRLSGRRTNLCKALYTLTESELTSTRFDTSLLAVLKESVDDVALQVRDKESLDAAFVKVQTDMLQKLAAAAATEERKGETLSADICASKRQKIIDSNNNNSV